MHTNVFYLMEEVIAEFIPKILIGASKTKMSCVYEVLKPYFKTCSEAQDRYSVHGPVSGFYRHGGYLNSSFFLWKFSDKTAK